MLSRHSIRFYRNNYICSTPFRKVFGANQVLQAPLSTESAPKLLSADERVKVLPDLSSAGWNVIKNRDALEKQFHFDNFVEAFGFMTKVRIRFVRLIRTLLLQRQYEL